ncbi:MAG: hypothetical protein ABI665_02125 [Vicinamibacterales bacterium]
MRDTTAGSPAKQLAGFIAKFDPIMQKRIKACRAELRKQMPAAVELVYDNYNFFVIGYGPNERASDAIVSLTAQASGTALCFIYGATMPDPKKLMQGEGNQVRSIKLPSADVLKTADVKDLIRAAIKHGEVPLPKGKKGYLVIKSVSAKQRPRRAT